MSMRVLCVCVCCQRERKRESDRKREATRERDEKEMGGQRVSERRNERGGRGAVSAVVS